VVWEPDRKSLLARYCLAQAGVLNNLRFLTQVIKDGEKSTQDILARGICTAG
jgi:hypothetical protein